MSSQTIQNISLKRTPLFEEHKKLKARIVPFAGYEMPVQYAGLIQEHLCVRQAAGLFDVSHMGVIRVVGKQTRKFLNYALTRDFSNIQNGQALYSLLCREHGGTVDDLIVYCDSSDEHNESYFIVLNASNKDKDLQYLQEINQSQNFQCEFQILFDSYSLLALQGPKSQEILKKLDCGFDITQSFLFSKTQIGKLKADVHIASTGYTGEKGCEIFVPNSHAVQVWNEILDAGKDFGIQAIGLGARDTLRTEMGYSLYGHELSENINPIEAGLKWAVGLKKSGDFIGKKALLKASENPSKKLICLKVNSKQAPRPEMNIYDSHQELCGHITSGTFAPSLGYSIGMALVSTTSQAPYSVDIRGNHVAFETCKRPFLTKEHK